MTPGRLEAAGRRQLVLAGHQVGSHDYKREDALEDIQDAPEGVPEDALGDVHEDALGDGLEDGPGDALEDVHEDALGDALEDGPGDALEDAPEDGLEDADFGHKQLDNKDLAAGLDCIGVVGQLTFDVGRVAVLASSAFVVVGFAVEVQHGGVQARASPSKVGV